MVITVFVFFCLVSPPQVVSDDGWECLKSTAKSCGVREVFGKYSI